MATKNLEAAAAAKAKKQKIILIVGGVLLLVVGALQGPKLMKGGSSPAPVVAAQGTTADATGATTATAAGVSTPSGATATAVRVSGPRAVLAGVTIRGGGGTPAAGEGQLLRFSLFAPKDPFVPGVSDEASGTTTTGSSDTGSTSTSADAGTTTSDSTTSPPPPKAPETKPVPLTEATILMNGKAYYLTVKDKFPQGDPLFVLVKVKQKVARIGVAGGSFADAATIPLIKGKRVTLVNDATGARYTLVLVFTGSAPEKTESFTKAVK